MVTTANLSQFQLFFKPDTSQQNKCAKFVFGPSNSRSPGLETVLRMRGLKTWPPRLGKIAHWANAGHGVACGGHAWHVAATRHVAV
jgi:hypothetical protein